MTKLCELWKKHKPTLLALLTAAACMAAALLVWLAVVRPSADKNLSEKLCDDYTVAGQPLADGESISQTFSTDSDLLALAFVFSIPGKQPAGELELTLTDAQTGEVLAVSTGDMANIVAGQYTPLGLTPAVEGAEGRQYRVTLTPRYTGGGELALCYSAGAVLWDDTLTQGGETIDGTLALLATTRRIGGFLTRFFLLVSLAACAVVFLGVRAALRGTLALHRLAFALILGFGLLYNLVLPPYAAPDEKYHINQSFTLACQWANRLSPDEWRMGRVPLDTSFRREHDFNTLLQNENTTVFTWEETVSNLFTTTTDSFDSHVLLDELQTDTNPLLYLVSAAAVFLGFVLHLGFVPTLMLGRLANLLLFAALAAWAIRRTPFGKRVFLAVSLLPMTLHLAASFSRDAPLLGLCFAFTALVLDAACGQQKGEPLPNRQLAALLGTGLLLAPGKAVYLPLAALVLLVPNVRFRRHAAVKKFAYLTACLVLALAMNSSVLLGAVETAPAVTEAAVTEDDGTAEADGDAVTQADAAASQSLAHDAVRSQPLPQDAAYEASIRENTVENYIRRLYFYFEQTSDVPQSELDFWAQALREGDVSAATLAQGFMFSETQMDTGFYTDDELIAAASLSMLGYDLLNSPPEADAYRAIIAEKGRIDFFKAMYSRSDFQQNCALLGIQTGIEDSEHYPMDRSWLAAQVTALRATRASQSTSSEEDLVRYTPAYILGHLPDTVLLVVRSLVQNGDHYLRTLVGGSLSYYTLDLAWGWVVLLYLLLAFAALPAADDAALPGRARGWAALAALACCALAVAGCITWTPVSHSTIYGLQGRYFLPVLPLLLLTCLPRLAAVPRRDRAAGQLACGLCLANAGVLLNAMLAVIAR